MSIEELTLKEALEKRLDGKFVALHYAYNELTLEVSPEQLIDVCTALRDTKAFAFNMLIDVCGVDYLHYGKSEWQTNDTTHSGFDRGVARENSIKMIDWDKPRFAVVYHLLSLTNNERLRVKVFCDDELPMVDSVIDLWPAADWFERECFDLYGILFKGHPDLRRLLTDYGFIGHPFRKDFPLSGNVEVRYDKATGRVIYEAVDIVPRTLVPKVIRDDNRYTMDPTKLTGEKDG